MLRSFTFVFFALVTLSGCCSKVDCDIAIQPLINVRFLDYTLSERSAGVTRIYGEKSGAIIDSFSLYDEYLSLHKLVPAVISVDIDTVVIVFDIAGRKDTLKDISYTAQTVRYPCNTCFLKKDDRMYTAYTINQYTFNGAVTIGNPDLIIRK